MGGWIDELGVTRRLKLVGGERGGSCFNQQLRRFQVIFGFSAAYSGSGRVAIQAKAEQLPQWYMG